MNDAKLLLMRLIRNRSLYYRSLFNPVLFYKSLLLNDKWVIETIFNGKRNGFFVEAGAYNGVFNSSCYTLEKHFGWSGICVEADSRTYGSCVKKRPGSKVENVALSDWTGAATFIEAATPGYSGLKQELQRIEEVALNTGWVKDQWRTSGAYVEKQVQVMTLHEVLQKHHAPETIDYLAMDIEGSEEAVLGAFPFDQYQIGCLSIEGVFCDDLLKEREFVRVQNPFNKVGNWEHYFVNGKLAAGLADLIVY